MSIKRGDTIIAGTPGLSGYVTETELEGKDYATNTTLTTAVNNLNTSIAGKQDTISDLETIRTGATLGSTALQSIPSEYITETELSSALANKQDTLTAGTGISISNNVISSTASVTIDNTTITENSAGQIQSSGTIEKNTNATIFDWIGTSSEWSTGRSNGTILDSWLCYITDDSLNQTSYYTKTEIDATIADINTTIGDISTALAEINGETV